MADRRTIASIQNVANALRGTDVLSYLKHLESVPFLRGELIEVTFNNDNDVTVRHRLGRRYIGGIKVSKTTANVEGITTICAGTFEASGGNPVTHVKLSSGINPGDRYTGIVKMWIF